MFDEEAGVLNDGESGGVSFGGCDVVGNSLLEPEDLGVDSHGGSGNRWHIFGTPENVNDVDGFGDVFQARVGFLAEDFGFVGIDGNNFVSRGLEIGGDGVGGAKAIGGEADNSDGFGRAEDVGDGVLGGRSVGSEVKEHECWMRQG